MLDPVDSHLVIQLTATLRPTASCIQVIVALHRAPFHSLRASKGAYTSFHEVRSSSTHATTRRRRESPSVTSWSSTIVRCRSSSAVHPHSVAHWSHSTITTRHWPCSCYRHRILAHDRVEDARWWDCRWWHEVVAHHYLVQAEVSGRAHDLSILDGEVAIASCIVPSLSKACRVEDIAVDQFQLRPCKLDIY